MKKIYVFDVKYNAILHPFNLESVEQLAVFIKEKSDNLTFNELKKNDIRVITIFNE
tara:strand:+ start:238 stop:405 length:168 start_codon:yes stop_codon:yes gene_type:complete